MNLSQVLLEGRKDEFLSKYKKKFKPENIKKIFLLSRELSSNQKFLNFLGKVVNDDNVNEDLVNAKIAIEKFIKYQKNLEEKDINQYDTLKDIKDAINKHENRIRRDVKEVEGADIVYEDDRFTVVMPKTHESSCYYGSGSKWCTAARNSEEHFMSYNRNGKLFYFLDKKSSTSNRFYKVAMLQKYDGTQQYFDAPDKSFHNGWILGTPEFDKINNVIQNYMESNYADDIELFKDKARAKQEMRRREQRDAIIRQERILRQMDDLRERDAWNRDNDLDDLGRKANAVFEGLVDEWGVEIGDDESIYNLVPNMGDGFYPGEIRGFKWLGEDENDSTYIVGEWDDVYEMAKNRVEEIVNDMGLFEVFNEDFIMAHLDVEKVVDWFSEYYHDYVRDKWEDLFDSDDLPLTKKQQSQLEKIEQEIEELYRKTRELENGEERDGVFDRIEELEGERDEIQENPEGEPTEEMIEEKIADYLNNVRQYPRQYLGDYGFDDDTERLEQFIDKNAIIEGAIDMDGVGHNISNYDGATFEIRVEGVDYYVFRID